jgi:hypothetical protein
MQKIFNHDHSPQSLWKNTGDYFGINSGPFSSHSFSLNLHISVYTIASLDSKSPLQSLQRRQLIQEQILKWPESD